jgi:hypothetical protein
LIQLSIFLKSFCKEGFFYGVMFDGAVAGSSYVWQKLMIDKPLRERTKPPLCVLSEVEHITNGEFNQMIF